MNARLLAAILLLALACAGPPARADETVVVKADEAKEPITLPPGFKPKKRGKFIVYCHTQSVLGSRFPAETCYDETGIRAYIQAQAENKEKVDQMRRICATQGSCGSN